MKKLFVIWILCMIIISCSTNRDEVDLTDYFLIDYKTAYNGKDTIHLNVYQTTENNTHFKKAGDPVVSEPDSLD